MNNDIKELRGHLFDTLRGLKEGSVDIEQAKAISQVASTIIQTAKVEVDYINATGDKTSGEFIGVTELPAPAATVRVHHIK